MSECDIDVSALGKERTMVTPNPVTITEIEPDRCIKLIVPGEGEFTITRDVAKDWYKQLREQLGDL